MNSIEEIVKNEINGIPSETISKTDLTALLTNILTKYDKQLLSRIKAEINSDILESFRKKGIKPPLKF